MSLSPDLRLPDGWRVVVPPADLELEPGQMDLVLTSILPAVDTPAGTYEIVLRFTDWLGTVHGEAAFTVHVESVGRLHVSVLEAPDLVPEGPFAVTYLVRNAGNTADNLTFSAMASDGVRATLDRQSAELGAGESVRVKVDVTPDPRERPARIRVELHVTSVTDPELLGSARVSVEAIPSRLPRSAALHVFPLVIRTSGRMAERSDTWAFDVAGTGALFHGDPGRLTLRAGVHRRAHARYVRPEGQIILGEQTVQGPVRDVSSPSADGVSLEAQKGRWSAHVSDVRLSDVGRQRELGIGYAPRPTSRLSLHRWSRKRESDPVWTVGAQWEATGDSELAVEWGCRFQHHPSGCGPQSFRLSGEHRRGLWSGYTTWQRWDPGFYWLDHGGERLQAGLFGRVGPTTAMTTRLATRRNRWPSGFSEPERASWRRESKELSAGVRMQGISSLRPWAVEYRWSRFQDEDPSMDRRSDGVRISMSPVRGDVRWSHELGWDQRVYPNQDRRTTSLSYTLRYRRTVAGSTLHVYGRAERLVEDGAGDPGTAGSGERDRFGFGLHVRRPLTDNTSGGLRFDMRDIERSLSSYGAEWDYDFGRSRRLTWSLGSYRESDGRTRWETRLALTFAFDVPIGRRGDVGGLIGRIVDNSGAPVRGMIVRVASLAVMTDDEGRFDFPAVPVGEHVVTLQPSRGVMAPLSRPATPWPVTVVPRETVDQTFVVLQGASVRGRVRLVEPEGTSLQEGAVFGGGLQAPSPDLLRNLPVHLVNEEGVHRTFSDHRGAFRFDQIVPGIWRLRVDDRALPARYRIQPAELRLDLEAGDQVDVTIDVVPMVRQLQIQDGGELTL